MLAIIPEQAKDPEVRLVQECLSGSQRAWDKFYCRYVGLVKSIVKRFFGFSGHDVEDITQNVFIHLIGGLKNYDAAYSLRRFICMIAEKACIEEYRSRTAVKRAAELESMDPESREHTKSQILGSHGTSQEDLLAHAELVDAVSNGIAGLDAKCQDLLRLRYYEGLQIKEMSVRLGTRANTVAVTVSRCLDQLRSIVRRQLGTSWLK